MVCTPSGNVMSSFGLGAGSTRSCWTTISRSKHGAVRHSMSSSLQACPQFAVVFRGPDNGIVDSRGFIERARDIERKAVFVDREAGEFRVHHLARRGHGVLEVAALPNRDFRGAIKRGDEVAGHRDGLARG